MHRAVFEVLIGGMNDQNWKLRLCFKIIKVCLLQSLQVIGFDLRFKGAASVLDLTDQRLDRAVEVNQQIGFSKGVI